MTLEEFAVAWKYHGISIDFRPEDLKFANDWATVVLGNYLMDEGSNKFNLGKSMLQNTEDAIAGTERANGKIIQ